MKKRPKWADNALKEWEFVALVALVALFLLTVLPWAVTSLRGGAPARGFPGGGRPPVPDSRVNYAKAYAMLEAVAPSEPFHDGAFRAGMNFAAPTIPAPEPPPKPKPQHRPPRKPDPEPAPEPVPQPEPAPAPEPPKPPETQFFVYRGYRMDDQGQQVAILRNETTGQLHPLYKGRRFKGLLVFDFTNSQITLMTPEGKTILLGPDDKLPYRLPPEP